MAPSDSSEIPAAMRALGNKKGTWPGDIKRLYSSHFLSYQATAPELPLLLDSFDGRRHCEFDAFAVDGGFSTWDLPIQRFKVSNDETATAFAARFDDLNTKPHTSIVFPDIYLQQRFLRALPTSGHRDFSEVLEKHHRVDFSNLAELQKAVVDEGKVLMKKAAFSGDDSSAAAAAAAHATDANLAPVSTTKAAKRKAKKARRRAKAPSATSESSSAPPIQFPHDPWSNAPACADDSQHDLDTGSTEYNY
jgi:hypothetical protein